MDHKAYKNIVPGADTAVLLIHGIVGTPNHFLPFLPYIPKEYSVYNLLLDGHGSSVKDFAHTSMSKWEGQVSSALTELTASHANIYIVAHSMGTLLAIEQAVKNTHISGLFLLAVPIKIRLRWRMIKNCIKVYLGTVSEHDTLAIATRDSCGIHLSKNLFAYCGWIPRYLELFHKIHDIRKLLPFLSVPCRVFQSCRDEMVSNKASAYLLTHSHMDVYSLECSTHFYYAPSELAFLQQSFTDFLNKKPRSI